MNDAVFSTYVANDPRTYQITVGTTCVDLMDPVRAAFPGPSDGWRLFFGPYPWLGEPIFEE